MAWIILMKNAKSLYDVYAWHAFFHFILFLIFFIHLQDSDCSLV